jgi:hypothetical protein
MNPTPTTCTRRCGVSAIRTLTHVLLTHLALKFLRVFHHGHATVAPADHDVGTGYLRLIVTRTNKIIHTENTHVRALT